MIRLLTLAFALLALALPAFATAASPDDVVRDCVDTGTITPGKYSNRTLRAARDTLEADTKAYYNCESLIARALAGPPASRAGLRGGGTGSGGAAGAGGQGSAPDPGAVGNPGVLNANGPDEERALTTARRTGEVTDPRDPLDPSQNRDALKAAAAFAPASVSRPIPEPLIVLLGLLGLTAALGAAWAVRRRVVGRRSA